MEKSNKVVVKRLQKFSRDLFRFNDPTVGWGEGEAYVQSLAWGRAALSFGAMLALTGLLAWSYWQLRQSPYQQFLRNCQRGGGDAQTCSLRWNK
ncbi:MAG: hypothetical protein Kow00121_28920 [Elainellaceae cyanobacterium]